MNLKTISCLIMVLVFCLSFVSAEVYDDFSSGELDEDLWTVSVGSVSNYLEEYYLDTVNANYHTAKLTAGEASVLLIMNREFSAGDSISYEVNYVSGSGNAFSRLYIDGNYLELRMRDVDSYDCGSCPTSGSIGYWNGDSEVGNSLGAYYVEVIFNEDTADISITNPEGEIWAYTTTSLSEPHTFGIETRTGHNGLVHFDYDNFEVLSEEETKEGIYYEWTFDEDAEGWSASGGIDSGWMSCSSCGSSGVMSGDSCEIDDGSDSPCSSCAAWWIEDIELADDVTTLIFDTSGGFPEYGTTAMGDGALVLKLQDETGEWHRLNEDCQRLDVYTWVEESVDISDFAGQTVTLRFETYNCGEYCNVEIRYVDNVRITNDEPEEESTCSCSEEIDELQSEINSLQTELTELQTQLSDTYYTKTEIDTEFSERDASISELQTSVESQEDEIGELYEYSSYFDSEISGLKTTTSSLQTAVSSLQTTVNRLTSGLNRLTQKVRRIFTYLGWSWT
ncbi:hypothetical protein HZB88_03615 [archaeon]|nr:hypothetical protein [archaeon]